MSSERSKDITAVRELAARLAEIASLPVQEKKRQLWRDLNGLHPQRPMVMIDQVCWNEINVDDELTLRCTDPICRDWEGSIRRTLFQWKHFPVDMVVEPFVNVPPAVHNSGFGVHVQQEVSVTDPTNSVVGHKFINQLGTDEAVANIQIPRLTHDKAETARRVALAEEIFGGLLEIRLDGPEMYISFWDPIAFWMSVEDALYAMIDQPERMHAILGRMRDGYLSMLDQAQEQALLAQPQSLIHCTGAWTDELPANGYNPDKPRTKDIWCFGLAQMLTTVSPEMFDEYEVQYFAPLAERFGLVYYGCCDPLDRKMAQVRKIPNVRKVSMSPWTDQQRGAQEIGKQYIFSRKPNPAFLASDTFNPQQVRDDLVATRDICKSNGCGLELILKDLSTVRYQPQRLFEWARIAMEVAGG